MKKLLQFVFLLLLLMMMTQVGWGATYTAASCSSAAMNAAISSASNGDTVLVPPGTCTWSSTVSTSKAISIFGCASPDYPGGCSGTTTITNSADPAFLISNTAANFFRISGFTINSSDSTNEVISITGPATKFRVDHIAFKAGDCVVCTNTLQHNGSGIVAGVVDHNTITDTGRGYFAQDIRTTDPTSHEGLQAWSEYLANPSSYAGMNGGDKMVYWEDNTYHWDRYPSGAQGSLYGQYGGKVVFRHNHVYDWSYFVDAHGDNPDDGTIFYEIYSNDYHESDTYLAQGAAFYLRGGQHIVHDESLTLTGDTGSPISLTVYSSADSTAHRINNTFIWNNMVNGVAQNNTPVCTQPCSGNNVVSIAPDTQGTLKQDVNFFLRAPSTGDVFAGYTPYTYPHPLTQNGAGGAPNPPSGLSASVQ